MSLEKNLYSCDAKESSLNNDGLQPTPTSNGLQPSSNAQLSSKRNLIAMASNLLAMASNLVAMPPT